MLYAVGGGIDIKGDKLLLNHMFSQAKGLTSKICIITSASSYPGIARRQYKAAFEAMGVVNYSIFHPRSPAEASDPALIEAAKDVDIIFFSGGDQWKLTLALAGSRLLQLTRDHLNAGHMVAGTSAGAAAMSDSMIYGEMPEDKEIVSIKEGFGFAPGIVFDTHFSQYHRMGRLTELIRKMGGTHIGAGLDEDTAATLQPDGLMTVFGSGKVTIIGPSGTEPTIFLSGQTHRFPQAIFLK